RRHTRSKRDWSSDVCSSDLHCRRALSGRDPLGHGHLISRPSADPAQSLLSAMIEAYACILSDLRSCTGIDAHRLDTLSCPGHMGTSLIQSLIAGTLRPASLVDLGPGMVTPHRVDLVAQHRRDVPTHIRILVISSDEQTHALCQWSFFLHVQPPSCGP